MPTKKQPGLFSLHFSLLFWCILCMPSPFCRQFWWVEGLHHIFLVPFGCCGWRCCLPFCLCRTIHKLCSCQCSFYFLSCQKWCDFFHREGLYHIFLQKASVLAEFERKICGFKFLLKSWPFKKICGFLKFCFCVSAYGGAEKSYNVLSSNFLPRGTFGILPKLRQSPFKLPIAGKFISPKRNKTSSITRQSISWAWCNVISKTIQLLGCFREYWKNLFFVLKLLVKFV